MPKRLLAWLVPIAMIFVVIVALVATTPLLAAVFVAVVGFVGVPFAYNTYRKNQHPGATGGASRRARVARLTRS
jgi:hypothetical protein